MLILLLSVFSAVHLQVLLLVGLIVFCLCLVLGCILCWRSSQTYPTTAKDPVTPAPASAEPVTLSKTPTPLSTTAALGRQYEELDRDLLEYPSTFTSSVSSEEEFAAQPSSDLSPAASEQRESPKSCFSLRRFSTPPLTSPLYKPIDPSGAPLPPFPRFGLSKTCKALKRRCTVTGSAGSHDERSRLTGPNAASTPEEAIPLAPLGYGSGLGCQQPLSPKPCLHFTMAFSPEERTLAITVLGLSGTPHSLEDVSVLGRLPPLYPCPQQASVQKSLSPESYSLLLLLKVSSVEELQRCVLKLTVYTQRRPSLSTGALGELETECRGREWRGENPLSFRKELNQKKWKLQEVLT